MENDRSMAGPDRPREPVGAYFACSLWLQVGFIGASALMIALMRLVDGGASPPLALAGALCAGLLTAFAWRRSRAVLDRVDGSAEAATPPAKPAAFGPSLESAASR